EHASRPRSTSDSNSMRRSARIRSGQTSRWASTNTTYHPASLPWHELHRRLAPACGAKAAHVLDRSGRGILLRVGALDGVADADASGGNRANPDLPRADLNGAARIVEERPVPPALLLHPGTGKHAAIYDDGPDRNEPMARSGASAHGEQFAFIDSRHDRARKSARHSRCSWPSFS